MEITQLVSNSEICKICNIENFKYVCPRCNIGYCSLACYKDITHGHCSEAFYREWIEEDLKNREFDSESKTKMIDILLKTKNEKIIDSDDDEDIAERMNGINLDDADTVWEKLTESERLEFTEMLKSGEVTKFVPLWIPWWSFEYSKKKVMILNEEDEGYAEFKKKCPPVKYNGRKLSQISSKPPSSQISNDLINILTAYSLCSRHYNGEHLEFAIEASSFLMNISQTLCKNQSFITAEAALGSALHEAINNPQVEIGKDNLRMVKTDVKSLLNGPNEDDRAFFVTVALNDVRSLFIRAKTLLKNIKRSSVDVIAEKFSTTFVDSSNIGIIINKVVLISSLKKIEYFVAWVNEFFSSLQETIYMSVNSYNLPIIE